MARPRVKIDVAELEKLYGMQCTDEEVAAFVGVSTRTLSRRREVKKFAEVIDRAKARGRVSVRRALFRLAAAGNIAAAIFLAKNLLGYKDIVSNEHSGPDRSPIQFENKPDFSQLSDEEFEQLRKLAQKTRPPNRKLTPSGRFAAYASSSSRRGSLSSRLPHSFRGSTSMPSSSTWKRSPVARFAIS